MQSPLPHPPSTPRGAAASRTLAPAPQAVKLSPTGHTPRRVVPGGGLEPLTVGKSAEATAPSAALEQSLPSLLTKDVYNPASAWHRVTDGHRAYFSRPEPFSKAYLGIEWAEFSLDEPREGINREENEEPSKFEQTYTPLVREQKRKAALAAVQQQRRRPAVPAAEPTAAGASEEQVEDSTDPEFWRQLLRRQNWMRQMLDGEIQMPEPEPEPEPEVQPEPELDEQALERLRQQREATAAEAAAQEEAAVAARAPAEQKQFEAAQRLQYAGKLEFEQAEKQQRAAELEIVKLQEEAEYERQERAERLRRAEAREKASSLVALVDGAYDGVLIS
jgi:hypothetical protein